MLGLLELMKRQKVNDGMIHPALADGQPEKFVFTEHLGFISVFTILQIVVCKDMTVKERKISADDIPVIKQVPNLTRVYAVAL